MTGYHGWTVPSFHLALGASLLGLFAVIAGCDGGVREDRTIEFSAGAESVGFQHGEQGVFVADKNGGGLKKVFQPGGDVLATSTPLWSPKERQLIFTTARADGPDPAASNRVQAQVRGLLRGTSDPDPAGDLFIQMPVVYTCWLRSEDTGEPPVKLFDAKCDHVGYVAANLAVRWHPQGDRVLYLNGVASGRHALFAYDLRTKASQKIFPHDAPALVFDWSPDGKHLACVLGTPRSGTTAATGVGSAADHTGLWIGQPDAVPATWWRVPSSHEGAPAEGQSLLEHLRAARPAWTADGGSIAFVTHRPSVSQSDPGESRLWIGRVAGRHVEQMAHDTARLHDLHWAPDGERLGLVRTATGPRPGVSATPGSTTIQTSTLHIWDRAGGLSVPVNQRRVQRFAGWCAAGDHLAYIGPDDVLGAKNPLWSFLLVPNPVARDAVVIANGNGAPQESTKPAFSGLRVTFPHWSPSAKDEALSLWCTFTPSHQSVLARFLGGGLRSGDPAAVFDARTGKLSWLAVSPLEEVQIGHYNQIKREYAEAWRRYESALAAGFDSGSGPESEPKSASEWLDRLFSPRGIAVFQFHCLTKLDRKDEARAKLASFRKTYPPQQPSGLAADGKTTAGGAQFPLDQPWFRDVMRPGGLCVRLLQDFYLAQVLLSLDASGDARDYFRSVVASGSTETDTARTSAAVVLSQVLLLERKHDEYAELSTRTLAPLLLKLHHSLRARPSPDTLDLARDLPDIVCGLALLPLTSRTFLAEFPRAGLSSLAVQWEAVRGQAGDDFSRLVVDLVLEASYGQLGQQPKRLEAVERIKQNSRLRGINGGAGGDLARGVSDELIESLRGLLNRTAFDFQTAEAGR
jgi:WD40 repeat protein